MSKEFKLYIYIYQQILQDIYSYKYSYGAYLPNLTALCEQYQVGRNTMRTALQKLDADGFLHCEKGRCPRVTLDMEQLENNAHFCGMLVGKKQAIHEVFDALKDLMPTCISMALKQTSDADIEELRQEVRALRLEELDVLRTYDCLMELYVRVLSKLQNTYIVDLFQQMMGFVYVPMKVSDQNEDRIRRSSRVIKMSIEKIMMLILDENDFMMKKAIQVFCDSQKKRALHYVERITKHYEMQQVMEFQWISNRHLEHLYLQVAGRVLEDIYSGVFADGMLPSLEQMGKRYATSQRTIRRCVQFLKELSIIETKNGAKARIVLQEEATLLQHPQMQLIVWHYCQCLELLLFITKAKLTAVLKQLNKQEWLDLQQKLEDRASFTLDPLLELLQQKVNPCLNIILKEVHSSLLWKTLLEDVLKRQGNTHIFQENIDSFMTAVHKKDIRRMNKEVELLLQRSIEILKQKENTIVRKES